LISKDGEAMTVKVVTYHALEPGIALTALGAVHGNERCGAEAIGHLIADIDHHAGPADAEPPSRVHGDLWPGNLLWSADGPAYLIDPAAHGGHRETDLAMLALFGAPFLDRILASYDETAPLAAGWRARVPLHQLHPLLVHACLFGAGYAGPVAEAARATLAA
jgi:fructosamine-3-kinase